LGKKVALLLPSMNVKRQELDSVGKIYPAFVEKIGTDFHSSIYIFQKLQTDFIG
jgi:hypothetical protein